MALRTYVLKQWKVDVNPVDDEDHFVVIHGRHSGLITWFLNLMYIAASTSLLVSSSRLEFRQSSITGEEHVLIPLEKLSSSFWGYRKPWAQALGVFILCACLLNALVTAVRFSTGISEGTVVLSMSIGVLVCAVLAIIYYYLNQTYVWGVTEISGHVRQILFKRSVIEGQVITQTSAAYASQVIQALIEAKSEK